MSLRQFKEAIELTGINEWGAGYFSINKLGDVVCTPTSNPEHSISLLAIVTKAKEKNI